MRPFSLQCCSPILAVALFLIVSAATGLSRAAYAQTNAAPAAAAAPQPKITLDLKDVPLREALEKLFAQAKVGYTIDSKVGMPVTLYLSEVPLNRALEVVLRVAGMPLFYTEEGGVYRVGIQENISPVERTFGFSISSGPSGGRNVTMRAERDYPLRWVLQTLFEQARLSYIIGPGVEGNVRLSFANIPFETALQYILRSATPPLTSSVADGVYIVRTTAAAAPAAVASGSDHDRISGALDLLLAQMKAERAAALHRLGAAHPEVHALDQRITTLTEFRVQHRAAREVAP